MGLPRWRVVKNLPSKKKKKKNLPSNAGDMDLIPSQGTMISHAEWQLSPRTTTEPAHSGAHAPLERSPHNASKILHAATKSQSSQK